jgi:hypothetical protein
MSASVSSSPNVICSTLGLTWKYAPRGGEFLKGGVAVIVLVAAVVTGVDAECGRHVGVGEVAV